MMYSPSVTLPPSQVRAERPTFLFNDWFIPLMAALFLVLAGWWNFLLFHVFSEFFAIFVALTMTVVAWNTFTFSRNHYLMFLGLAYFWVAVLDMVHTLLYRGMGIYPLLDANMPTQLWLAARFFEAVALLFAPYFLHHSLSRHGVFLVLGGVSAILFLLIVWGFFPDAFVEGQGLTLFKRLSEFVIIAILALAMFNLRWQRHQLDRRIGRLMTLSILFTMVAELAFTFYVHVYGLSNLVGHIFKFWSFWLIFVAIIRTTLSEPLLVMSRGFSTFDAIPLPTLLVTREGRIVHANQAVARESGQPVGTLIGLQAHDLFHPQGPPLDCILCQHTREQMDFPATDVAFPEKGAWREMALSAFAAPGDFSGMVLTTRDVTERKKLTEAWRVGNEHMKLVLDTSSSGSWDWWIPGGEFQLSDHWLRSLGHEPGGREGHVHFWQEMIHPDDYPRVMDSLNAHFSGKSDSFQVECRLRSRSGAYRWHLSRGKVVLRDEQGQPLRIVGIDMDISERKELELILRESEALFRSFFEKASVGMVILDADFRFLRANQALCGMVGQHVRALTGKPFSQVVARGDWEQRTIGLRLGESDSFSWEEPLIHKEGVAVWGRINMAHVRKADGSPHFFIAQIENITHRRQAELDLRASENFNRRILASIGVGVVVYDQQLRYKLWNPFLVRLTGVAEQELLGQVAQEHFPNMGQTPVWILLKRALSGESLLSGDLPFQVDGSGRKGWINGRFSPFLGSDGQVAGVVAIIHEVTARKEAELNGVRLREQATRSAHLASLGLLAASVAHEINNPNSLIHFNAPMIKRILADTRPALAAWGEGNASFTLGGLPYPEAFDTAVTLIGDVEEASLRIARIVSQLKGLVRNREKGVPPQRVDVGEIVTRAVGFLRHRIDGCTAHFRLDVPEKPLPVQGQPQRLEQLFINLLMNALESLPDPSCGVHVRLEEDGAHVVVTLTDQGTGMSPETLERIGEPLFTTKEEGTGLGIALCQRIVKEHGGQLSFTSRLREGTAVEVRLSMA